MSHISEYEVENILIDRLESIGYSFIKLNTYRMSLPISAHSLQNSTRKSWKKKAMRHPFLTQNLIVL